MTTWRVAAASVMLLLTLAPSAAAQADWAVGLGGGVAFYHALDDEASDSTGFALTYRFGKPSGFRPTFGMNWFTTDFDVSVGGERIRFGDLRVRPLMGGYLYGIRRGATTISASLVGGYSFNSFDLEDRARLAFNRNLQTTLLAVSASNSLAGRAEISVWYDVASRIGVQGVFGYVVVRPEIEMIQESSVVTRRLRADALKVQIAVAYGIF